MLDEDILSAAVQSLGTPQMKMEQQRIRRTFPLKVSLAKKHRQNLDLRESYDLASAHVKLGPDKKREGLCCHGHKLELSNLFCAKENLRHASYWYPNHSFPHRFTQTPEWVR